MSKVVMHVDEVSKEGLAYTLSVQMGEVMFEISVAVTMLTILD